MSNDEYFNKKVMEVLAVFQDADQEALYRLLFLFAMDIERDTRHQASEMIGETGLRVRNMEHKL